MLLTVDAMYPVPVMDHSSDFSVIFPVRRIASGVSTDDATTNTLDITIGNVIVFATPSLGTSTSNTHCLYGQHYPCDRAFSCTGISLLRFIVRGNHNCICCTLRPVRANHKSGKISRPHGHHSSHRIGDVYWQSEALSHSI